MARHGYKSTNGPGRGGKNKNFTVQLQSSKELMYRFKILKVFCKRLEKRVKVDIVVKLPCFQEEEMVK